MVKKCMKNGQKKSKIVFKNVQNVFKKHSKNVFKKCSKNLKKEKSEEKMKVILNNNSRQIRYILLEKLFQEQRLHIKKRDISI
jgi:GTPase SAR1 family protein